MLVRGGGRERSGQFVSPQDRFSCWAKGGKPLDTRNSGASISSTYHGEILVHNLDMSQKTILEKNLTFTKLYFTLTSYPIEMSVFANRQNRLRRLFFIGVTLFC